MSAGFHVYRHPGADEPCATVGIGDTVLACSATGGTLGHVMQTGTDVQGRAFAIVRCDCGCGSHGIALAEHILGIPRDAVGVSVAREWGRA